MSKLVLLVVCLGLASGAVVDTLRRKVDAGAHVGGSHPFFALVENASTLRKNAYEIFGDNQAYILRVLSDPKVEMDKTAKKNLETLADILSGPVALHLQAQRDMDAIKPPTVRSVDLAKVEFEKKSLLQQVEAVLTFTKIFLGDTTTDGYPGTPSDPEAKRRGYRVMRAVTFFAAVYQDPAVLTAFAASKGVPTVSNPEKTGPIDTTAHFGNVVVFYSKINALAEGLVEYLDITLQMAKVHAIPDLKLDSTLDALFLTKPMLEPFGQSSIKSVRNVLELVFKSTPPSDDRLPIYEKFIADIKEFGAEARIEALLQSAKTVLALSKQNAVYFNNFKLPTTTFTLLSSKWKNAAKEYIAEWRAFTGDNKLTIRNVDA